MKVSYFRLDDAKVAAFLGAQREAGHSYEAVGATRGGGAPAGFDHDVNAVRIGVGERAFRAACAALRGWRQFPRPWTRIGPAGAPLTEGMTVAVLFHYLGLWWLNACRIVYVIDEPRRFGFAYGTLPAHVERGEERFMVEWRDDGEVWYSIEAFSRPRFILARLAKPLARRGQRRFVRESQAAMRAATEGAR